MKKTVLIFGSVSGVIVSVWMAVSMMMSSCKHDDITRSMFIGFLGMFVSFIFIFVAIKNYRDTINGGSVSFGKAFTIGFLVAFIASLFYVATWYVVYHNYMPNFMEDYTSHMIEQYKSDNLPAAELQAKIAEMNEAKENYKNPFYFVCYTLFEILPVGIIVSVIAALILKRRQKMA